MNAASFDDVVVAWVARTCLAQGVPVKITDPGVLGQIGALLGARARPLRAHGASAPRTKGPRAPLDPPLGPHPFGV